LCSSRRQHTSFSRDWSSDVCSSDLDSERVSQAYARMNRCPLGAAALAGTSHPLDREATAAALGFDGPVENTYDAVASADWEVDQIGRASCREGVEGGEGAVRAGRPR